MAQSEKKKKRYFWYILYGILLLTALLYYRFPSDAFSEYIKASAERLYPQYRVSIGKLDLSFPSGLRLMHTALFQKARPADALFKAERLVIRPEILSLLKGNLKVGYTCRAYEGDVEGEVSVAELTAKAPFTASMQLRRIHIDAYPRLANLVGREVKGFLGGTVGFEGRLDLPLEGSGEANLRVMDGEIAFALPLLQLGSIRFDEMLVELALKKRRITLNRAELRGPEIQGTVSGTIMLRGEIEKSTLNLKGTMEPLSGAFTKGKGAGAAMQLIKQHLKRGKLSFTIHGTLEEPRIRFI